MKRGQIPYRIYFLGAIILFGDLGSCLPALVRADRPRRRIHGQGCLRFAHHGSNPGGSGRHP